MATLTNTQISVTYVGLLKTSANTVLSSTAQQITDGSGNNSIIFLSTAGVGIGGAAASGKELDVTGNVLITGDLQVDNINIDGNTISSTAGTDLNITPLAGQQIVLDGTIVIDAGVVTGATSITSTSFVGELTGNASTSTKIASITNSNIVQLTSSQTLTNKTIDVDNNTVSNIEVDNLKSGVLDTDLSSVSGSDDTLASAKAIKTYVDAQVDTADELSEILAIGNTTGATKISVNNTSSGIDFIDDAKARFGTGNDAEIYGSSDNLYIDQNTADKDILLRSDDGSGNLATYIFLDGSTGAVELNHYGTKKFQTTSTGVQVTGSNLSVLAGSGATKLQFVQTDGNWKIEAGGGTNQLVIHSESLVADYVTIKGGGVVQLNDYGSGSNTGTAAYNLSVDSSGNIIETAGGVVDGSGTANDVAMWSDSNTLTDAPIAISGNNATFAGSVTANTGSKITSSSADTTFSIETTSGTTIFPVLDFVSSHSSAGARIRVSGTDVISIDKSQNATFAGNLGIGSSPDVKIHAVASGTKISPLAGTVLGIQNNSSTSTNCYISALAGNAGAAALVLGDVDDNDQARFQLNNSGSLLQMLNAGSGISIDTSGRVGIGTTSPSTKLHISGGDPSIRLTPSGSNDARVDFTDSGGTVRWYTGYDVSSGNLVIASDEGGFGSSNIMVMNDSGNVGIGISTIARGPLHVHEGSTGYSQVHLTNSSSGSTSNDGLTLFTNGNDAGLMQRENSYLLFGTNDTERMRITSSSNPTLRLGVSGTGTSIFEMKSAGGGSSVIDVEQFLQIKTSGSEKLRIDSSGRVGINETSLSGNDAKLIVDSGDGKHPAIKANDGRANGFTILADNYTATESQFNIGVGYSGGQGVISHNCKVSDTANNVFLSSNAQGATKPMALSFDAGDFIFRNTNTSATTAVDTAVTLTERMRIDNSGNIFATNSSNNLVLGNSATGGIYIGGGNTNTNLISFQVGSAERMRIDSSGNVGIGETGARNARLLLNNAGSSGAPQLMLIDSGDSSKQSEIRFDSGNLYFEYWSGSSRSERMRIDSSGRLVLGTTSYSSAYAVTVAGSNGTYAGAINLKSGSNNFYIGAVSTSSTTDCEIYNAASGFIRFATNATERMRITSGGKIGLAMQNYTLNPSSTNYGVFLETGAVGKSYWQSAVNAATNHYHYEFINTNGQVGTISTSGSATAYNTSSDYRLKENVVEMTGALDRVSQLKPSRFNFISDADTTVDGFLAHEVQEIVPEAITGEKDAVDEEGNPIYQGIDQSKLVPLLVGAIKELKAEIETLKTQINS